MNLVGDGFEIEVIGLCSIPGILPKDFILFPTKAQGDCYLVQETFCEVDNGIWKPHIRLFEVEVDDNWDILKSDISQIFLPGFNVNIIGSAPPDLPDWVKNSPAS